MSWTFDRRLRILITRRRSSHERVSTSGMSKLNVRWNRAPDESRANSFRLPGRVDSTPEVINPGNNCAKNVIGSMFPSISSDRQSMRKLLIGIRRSLKASPTKLAQHKHRILRAGRADGIDEPTVRILLRMRSWSRKTSGGPNRLSSRINAS